MTKDNENISELPKRYNEYPELKDWYYEKYNMNVLKMSKEDAIKFTINPRGRYE